MTGWLIALGILILLAILPLGVSAVYGAEGLLVRVIAGPVRVKVFPRKKKEKQKKAEKSAAPKKSTQKKDSKDRKKQEDQSGGSIFDFLPLLKVALDFLNRFRKKLRVDLLEMKLIMAGGDPCDLAVNYARAWAVLENIHPLLDRAFVIKKRNLNVACDFTADKTLIYARLDLTITLGRLLTLLVYSGVYGLKEYLKIKNKRKGGAET